MGEVPDEILFWWLENEGEYRKKVSEIKTDKNSSICMMAFVIYRFMELTYNVKSDSFILSFTIENEKIELIEYQLP